MQNRFAELEIEKNATLKTSTKFEVPNYEVAKKGMGSTIFDFFVGFFVGMVVFNIFYKLFFLSILGGVTFGIYNIFAGKKRRIVKRRRELNSQFYELLEAMSVSLRAGNPVSKSIADARKDLSVIYPENSDIIIELDLIIAKFNNSVVLSKAFEDLAERSSLEDIKSFASVYKTIEGKSSRADEIIRETQQIILDKMEIELEIETLMTAAKSEVTIMLFMPLIILGIMGYMGGGFLDAIYTTREGRIVATFGLIMFFVSYALANLFSKIEI